MEALARLEANPGINPGLRTDLATLWTSVWAHQQQGTLLWSVCAQGPNHTVENTSSPALGLIDAWRGIAGIFPFHMDDALYLMGNTNLDGTKVVTAEAVERTIGVRANLTWFLDEAKRGSLVLVLKRIP